MGDDAPKFDTPQRETKNKKTISNNDSNLHHSSDADLNDKNANLLPSNANDHNSDLSSLCPANDVETKLWTPSHKVWIYRLPFGGNHTAPMLPRERNKSPLLALPNNDVQVSRFITYAPTAACRQGRFLKPVIVQFSDSTRERINKREREAGMLQRETAITLVNKGERASTRDYASTRDRLSTRKEESASHPSLPSKKLCLEHEFDDILLSTKPSWRRHATEMVDNATWLLREHQLEYTIKMFHSCINYETRDSSKTPTHWVLHRRIVQDEGIFLHPNPDKVFKYHCNTNEAGSWSQCMSARNPNTTESQIGWIISCFDWPTIWFFRLQPHMFLSPTEDCYATVPMSLRDVLPIICLLDKIR